MKNILFDLGGVLLDLDIAKTENTLASFRKTKMDIGALEALFFEKLMLFEKGAYSEELFINFLLKHSNYKTHALDIINAWNSMLNFVEKDRFDMVTQLTKHYNLFVLSNTNPIHFQWLKQMNANMESSPKLFDLFEEMYFSHLIEQRKPDREAFEIVLSDANILASETLFIDDLEENIDAAQELGFMTYHLKSTDDLIPLCERLLK